MFVDKFGIIIPKVHVIKYLVASGYYLTSKIISTVLRKRLPLSKPLELKELEEDPRVSDIDFTPCLTRIHESRVSQNRLDSCTGQGPRGCVKRAIR